MSRSYDPKTGVKFGRAWKRRYNSFSTKWDRQNYRPLTFRQRELACLMTHIFSGPGEDLWMNGEATTNEWYDVDPPAWAWYWYNRMYAYDGDLLIN